MSSIVFLASNHLEMERLRNQVVRHTSSPHMIQFTFDLVHNVVCELQCNGQKDKDFRVYFAIRIGIYKTNKKYTPRLIYFHT